jgi:membrane-bound ClpP family serine protease
MAKQILRSIATVASFLLAAITGASAMDFNNSSDHLTVRATGPIEKGDATKFAELPKFETLELDSPGGLVGEALAIAANIDARGGIRTVVKAGASCASACQSAPLYDFVRFGTLLSARLLADEPFEINLS